MIHDFSWAQREHQVAGLGGIHQHGIIDQNSGWNRFRRGHEQASLQSGSVCSHLSLMEAEPLSVGSGFKMKRGSGASDPHFNRGLSDGEAFECCNGSGTRHSPDHHSIGALQPHAVPYLRPIFPQRNHGSCPAHVALVRIEAKLGLEGPVLACR